MSTSGNAKLERIEKDEVPPAHHFDFFAVYRSEYNRILSWLKSQANTALSMPNATKATALARTDALVSQIKNIFGSQDGAVKNISLMTAAGGDELGKAAPSRGALRTYQILALISAFAEVAVGFVLLSIGENNIMIVAITTLMAIGGLVAGAQLGNIFFHYVNFPESWQDQPERESMTKHIIYLVLSVALTILIAVFRTGGAAEGAFYVIAGTLLLAGMVAMFESLHRFYEKKYNHLRERMFRCQRQYATEKHSTNCESSKDGYATQYAAYVNEIPEALDETLRRKGG